MTRRHALIETNLGWLRQALRLIDRLDDRVYAATAPGFAPHRAGAHLRHIVEFYRAFLDGVKSRTIDYDARRRDPLIERSREAAAAAVRAVIVELERSPALRLERRLRVRMEDAPPNVRDPFLETSAGRELQVLSSHTIHHFALMALALRAHGVQVDPEFGMAPSTLRHLERAAEAA